MAITTNGYASAGYGFGADFTIQSYSADEVSIVTDPLGRGFSVYRFEQRITDGVVAGGYRSEIKLPEVNVASERWYRFGLILMRDEYRDAHPHTIIWQMHSTDDAGDVQTRVPCLAIEVVGNWLEFTGGYDATDPSTGSTFTRVNFGRIPIKWNGEMEIVMRAKWAYDGTGLLKVYYQDYLTIDYSGGIAFNDAVGPYPKFGCYAAGGVQANSTPRVLYHRGLIIGDQTSSYSEITGGRTALSYPRHATIIRQS